MANDSTTRDRQISRRKVLLAAGTAVGAAVLTERTKTRGPRRRKIRVLFVGGDWKSLLPNYRYLKDNQPAVRPLRGFYVKQRVDQTAPGQFEFTLWTSYEFLQYGDRQSLREFDMVVMEDVMGTSMVPRVVEGMRDFVAGGGGVMFGDGFKAMMYDRIELSFDAIMPIDVVPFRPYGPSASQPVVRGHIHPQIVAPHHPVVRGLDFSHVPPMTQAHYGRVKAGATVLATMPDGKPLWVVMTYKSGRTLWTGGFFSNDEFSEEFAQSAQFGPLYVQALQWLADGAHYAHPKLLAQSATGTLRVDFSKPGPEVTARIFSINGQESTTSMRQYPDDYSSERIFSVHGGPMAGVELELFRALDPAGGLHRTAAGSPPEFVKLAGRPPPYRYVDQGTSLDLFTAKDFDFHGLDATLADIVEHLRGQPILLAWCPWAGPGEPSPQRYAHYFAAELTHVNNAKTTAGHPVPIHYFEEMLAEPEQHRPEWLNRYMHFFTVVTDELKPHFTNVRFGAHGFSSYPYCLRLLDHCGEKLDWLSIQPYGQTGEAIFNHFDELQAYAHRKGLPRLQMILTEWDFWLYGHPAFDAIMQMWKPAVAHADTCVGILHYRWTEYNENGYGFGMIGQGTGPYGQLPPQWPRPGLNKPITYRYNALWIMRDCRGISYPTVLDVPDMAGGLSPRAYAITTVDGRKLNIVIYYGYPYHNVARRARYEELRLHVQVPIPPAVTGRKLTIARANAVKTTQSDGGTVSAGVLDLEITIPHLSGVSLTVA